MDATPNLGLPRLAAAQSQKHVTLNEGLDLIDALVQLIVVDRDQIEPPPAPMEGERRLVAAGATGSWAGRDGQIAIFTGGGWRFVEPQDGWTAFIASEGRLAVRVNADWAAVAAGPELQNLARLGVGTTADATNPLSARVGKALISAVPPAEGGDGDLRVTFNKSAAEDVLSLLFQSNWSGRAEIGLVGTDDLSIRVSPDGASWLDAISVNRANGLATLGGVIPTRDGVLNSLPDSGRFIGAGNNQYGSGLAWSAPGYLSAPPGGTLSAFAKFIYNNTDYGGTAGTLDPEVRALIDKIRPASDRRYGAEWWVAEIDQRTSGAMSETLTVNGTLYGLAWSNLSSPLHRRFTTGLYLKVKTGSAYVRAPAAGLWIDGVASPSTELFPASGWKHLLWHGTPNGSGYSYKAWDVLTPLGAEVWTAMMSYTPGWALLDPSVGVVPNEKNFG